MRTAGLLVALALASLFIAQPSRAGGLLGDALKGLGRATGIKPLEKAGTELDNAHRDIKEAIPPYKAVEEASSDFVRKRFLDACNAGFQSATAFVIGRCSNWDGRTEDQHLIQQAAQSLVNAGLFAPNEFQGVQIRWCPLSGAHGMAPDRGRIYLDTAAKNDNPINLAALLAHEMFHIRQYRAMGTDKFKCEYSRKYVECSGCQDDRHSMERDAYAFESAAYERLTSLGWKMCNQSSHSSVWVAYAYGSPSGWTREGWREIPRGQCSLLVQNIQSRYLYYYAIGPNGAEWSGDHSLCLHPQDRFTLGDTSSCEEPYEARRFHTADTKGAKAYRVNLTD